MCGFRALPGWRRTVEWRVGVRGLERVGKMALRIASIYDRHGNPDDENCLMTVTSQADT